MQGDGDQEVDHQFRPVGMVQPPGLPPAVLRRARLTDQLTVAARRRVTVVSAGPGWGKTMAAASWAASGSAQDPVAWWNLTDADNNPASFWPNLKSAVVASGAVPDRSPLRDHHPAAMVVNADLDELWAQLADLPAPVVLVIDDFQVITHDDVLRQFGLLISELPPTPLRLVLLTHRDPTLPLHVLRVSGELTEIRAADLAFTPEEVTQLFTCNAVHLRAEQVTRILNGTGGWPARVPAAALADPLDVDAGITRICSAHRGAFDHFIIEVLRALSPPDREFLLRISKTEMLNGDLANQLTGRTDSQSVLERLFESNVFTVRREQHGWYSYQPLFRNLLTILQDLQQPPAAAAAPGVHHAAGDA